MFGAGWAAGKVAKEIAKASGASEEDAETIGKAAKIAVSIAVFDVSTFMDIIDLGS